MKYLKKNIIAKIDMTFKRALRFQTHIFNYNCLLINNFTIPTCMLESLTDKIFYYSLFPLFFCESFSS